MATDYGDISIEEITTLDIDSLIDRVLENTSIIREKHKIINNICIAAIKNNGLKIAKLTGPYEQYRTQRLCSLAVENNGLSLSFLYSEERTLDICLKALKNNIRALAYLNAEEQMALALDPKSAKSFFLLINNFSNPNLKLFDSNINCYSVVDKASEIVSWFSFCNLIKRLSPPMLVEIEPIICKAISLCLKTDFMQSQLPAFRSVDRIIPSLPQQVITKAICLEAIKHHWEEINYVPEDVLDLEILTSAVQINGIALKFMPAKWLENMSQRPEYLNLFIEAVSNNALALQYVPDTFKKDVIESVGLTRILSNHYLARQFIPKDIHYAKQIEDICQLS